MDAPSLEILVTGSSGFIGRHVVRHLAELGHRITALDYRPPIDPLPNGAHFFHADIRQGPLPRRRFAAVVHLAARAGVRPSMDRPLEYMETNVTGTVRLLESCRELGSRRFVFASSSSVYGPSNPLPFLESGRPAPCSPYALTKLLGEEWGAFYARTHGMRFTALRLFSVWGEGQRPDLALERFRRRLLMDEPLEINGDGSQRRDLTHVSDVARAIALAVLRDQPGHHVFNIGTGKSHSVLEIVKEAERFTGKKARIRHLPANPADVPETLASIEKSRNLLGWSPAVAFPDHPEPQSQKV